MNDPLPEVQGTFVVARLPARIGPILRGEIYEDPLDEALGRDDGIEVTGGGTMMGEDGDILFIDVEISIDGDLDPALDRIVAGLEGIGAPRGTQIINDEGETLRTCGSRAIAGLVLDGVTLPQEVYDTCSADDVLDAMLAALGSGCGYAGYHAMSETTVLYFHGEDYAKMAKAMKKKMTSLPLCQGATLIQVA